MDEGRSGLILLKFNVIIFGINMIKKIIINIIVFKIN